MKDLKDYTEEQLLTFYCNAKVTGARCLGHGKSAGNDRRLVKYTEELKARGASLPTDQQAYERGQFNGQGSY